MENPPTLAFETFWSWLVTHPNCILRAGTSEAVIYDDDDLHWHFAIEETERLLVQVLRGKRLVGEFLVEPERVSYVQAAPGTQDGEYLFELIAEGERDRVAEYFFVLTHGYETEEGLTPGRVH